MVKKIRRQFSLPAPSVGLLEILILSCVFLSTAAVGLKSGVESIILPLLVFVVFLMMSMVVSGVYRSDIARSVISSYKRTLIGYLIAGVCLLVVAMTSASQFFDVRFIGFVLFFSFCVISTIRQLISEVTHPMGDRRS